MNFECSPLAMVRIHGVRRALLENGNCQGEPPAITGCLQIRFVVWLQLQEFFNCYAMGLGWGGVVLCYRCGGEGKFPVN